MLCVPVITMKTLFLDFVFIVSSFAIFDKYFEDIQTVFPSRANVPGLQAPEKLWWAKEITPDFHVCGRLSERQIKLAADAGFKSILSLFTYPTGDPGGEFGGDYLPITDEEKIIVEEIAGLQFVNLLDPMDEWASVEAIEKFTAIVPHLKTPALLRCDRGYTITFVTLLYLANQTRYSDNFKPQIRTKEFYEITAAMGLDFLSRIPMEVVSEITGESIPDKLSINVPKFDPVDWLDYWFAHAVHVNWFIAGQITKAHLQPLEEFGYKIVVNLRPGPVHKGRPSQGEVNLLNIRSGTGTYGDGDFPPRQSHERLQQTLIDPKKPNSFISNESDRNYEDHNAEEFGDGIGYNEQLEQQAFNASSSLEYHHMPLATMSGLGEFFKKYGDDLMELGRKGPVLVHCGSGKRAAHVATLAAALQHNLSLNWALQRLKEMGFGVAKDKNPDVYNAFKELLPADDRVEL